ncbi:TerB family tellurite resistance protein [Leptospira kanakyensis]|nr:TerB family tellurite resistance protein [Leptospira kanakyensis]MCW7468975.1 TerB family tellurite resistance protein [Leptospira kanakyensis]
MKLNGESKAIKFLFVMAKKIVQNLKQVEGNKNKHPESIQSTLDIESDLHIEYAKVLLSLWSYACNADGQFKKKEGDIVGELVNVLFEPGCLLSGFQDQKKTVLEILSKTFENPLPMKTITKVVSDNDEYALNFFEDAVCIVASDGALNQEEIRFLEDLATELKISHMDKVRVEKKYLA